MELIHIRITKEVMNDLQKIKITYGNFKIRFDKTIRDNLNGRCTRYANETYQIKINPLLKNNEVALYSTIMHEVLHTCGDSMKHTGKWKRLANEVNKSYPNKYDIRRTNDYRTREQMNAEFNYLVECKNCNTIIGKYKREGKYVKLINSGSHRLRCACCKSNNLIVIDTKAGE